MYKSIQLLSTINFIKFNYVFKIKNMHNYIRILSNNYNALHRLQTKNSFIK